MQNKTYTVLRETEDRIVVYKNLSDGFPGSMPLMILTNDEAKTLFAQIESVVHYEDEA